MSKQRFVKHKKRGTAYEVLGEAEAQISSPTTYDGSLEGPGARLLFEGQKLTVYRCVRTGKLWARFPDEFEDGRFQDLHRC